MALLVTLFLVLVNIFNSVTANAPKSEGLTAVETWVVMCIVHVFCVLAEYAIILKVLAFQSPEIPGINFLVVLKIIQMDKYRADKARKALATANNAAGSNGKNSEHRMQIIHQQRLPSGSSTPLEQIFETEFGPPASSAAAAATTTTTVARPSSGSTANHLAGASSSASNQLEGLNHSCGAGAGGCGMRHRHHHPRELATPPDYPSPSAAAAAADGNGCTDAWNKMDLTYMRLAAGQQQHQSQQLQQPQQQFRSRRGIDARIAKIDRVAMWVFPIFFCFFNIGYWSYYLLMNNMRDMW
jgi:hypothetical protein